MEIAWPAGRTTNGEGSPRRDWSHPLTIPIKPTARMIHPSEISRCRRGRFSEGRGLGSDGFTAQRGLPRDPESGA